MKKAFIMTAAAFLLGVGSIGFGAFDIADLPSQHTVENNELADLPSQHSTENIELDDLPSQHSVEYTVLEDLPSQHSAGNGVV